MPASIEANQSSDAVNTMTSNVGCFLCEPPTELNYIADERGMAVSGLGPLTPDYSVVAALPHVKSAADSLSEYGPGFIEFASAVRERLLEKHGSCLLTEHGRMPVCGATVAGERHCYHAHFLLFPTAPNVIDQALPLFRKIQEASNLSAALRLAKAHPEYFLISPAADSFLILSGHQSAPRQLARSLVANALGIGERAHWQNYPDREVAAMNAKALRQLFAEGIAL